MIVSPEEKVSSILRDIKKNRTMIVADKKNYLGIITDRFILNSQLDPNTKVKNVMIKAPLIERKHKIEEIANFFLNGYRELPYFDGKDFKIISFKDVIKDLLKNGKIPNIRIGELQLDEMIKIESDKSIAEAVALLRKNKVHHLAITEDGKIVSVVTISDLLPYIQKVKERNPIFREKIGLSAIKISSIPALPKIYSIEENKTLIDAAKAMMENDVMTLLCKDKFIHFYNILKLSMEKPKIPIEIVGLEEEDLEYRDDIRKELENILNKANKIFPVDLVRLKVKSIRKTGERKKYILNFFMTLGSEKIAIDASDWEIHKALHYIKEEVEKIIKRKKEKFKGKKIGRAWRRLTAKIREGEYPV